MSWQPIETAPNEDIPILVAYDDGSVEFIENSSDYDWHPYHGHRGYSASPTHWMPLPEAPKP